MESGFYVIIMLLIFLKLMIWMCVFYARSRRRQMMANAGIIIVQGERGLAPNSDMQNIINAEQRPGVQPGVDNPMMRPPPSYDEVQHTKEEKPPSYEQVFSGNPPPQQGFYPAQQPQPQATVPQPNVVHGQAI